MSLLSLKENPLIQLRAGMKYLLSFTRADWQLADYPIRFRYSRVTQTPGRLKQFPWSCQIINWWQIGGFGGTKKEAYADLQKRFAEIKSNSKSLPRPGTGAPIEFASTERVQLYDDIANDFFDRVLDMNYGDCLITDESSLWDFHVEESNEHLYRKIWNAYRTDVSDIDDGNLVTIFERIENRGRT
jgi:hypothetical protein